MNQVDACTAIMKNCVLGPTVGVLSSSDRKLLPVQSVKSHLENMPTPTFTPVRASYGNVRLELRDSNSKATWPRGSLQERRTRSCEACHVAG